MADDRRVTLHAPASLAGIDVRGLAQEAIRVLANQTEEQTDRWKTHLDRLCEAFLSEEEELRRSAIQELLGNGTTIPDIVDHVIPEVARIYGQRWADDTLSFAEVSIGSARLQEAVRGLVARNGSSRNASPDGSEHDANHLPRVLLVVPRPEDHTLGTFVAADQFRRQGYGVDILVDEHPRQVALEVRKHHYVMVGITVGGRRTLASARELVDIIRTTVRRVTPIVLGGSFVDTGTDLKQATGVDHVAVSVMDALGKCDLDIVGADPS